MKARRALFLFLLLGAPVSTSAGEWAVNVYGLSYHRDRERARELGVDNEVNPGLAARYEWSSGLFAEAGAYRDSGRNTAKFAGAGYQWRLGTSWRAGGGLALFQSETYNEGSAFIAAVPIVSYDFGPVMLNAVFFPKVSDFNEVGAFGFYLTVPIAAR